MLESEYTELEYHYGGDKGAKLLLEVTKTGSSFTRKFTPNLCLPCMEQLRQSEVERTAFPGGSRGSGLLFYQFLFLWQQRARKGLALPQA